MTRFGTISFLLLVSLQMAYSQWETTTQRSSTDTGTTVVVYVLPTAGTGILVSCWSNNTNLFHGTQNFTYTGEISWSCLNRNYGYNCNQYDTFWCRARTGSNILLRFPVYGGGVERNSSEWVINSRGKRRLSLNSKQTDDFKATWIVA